MRGKYARTKEHKQKMAESCAKAADGPHIRARRGKHRVVEGVEQRYCSFCSGWFPLVGDHFYTRKCKSKSGRTRIAYDCRALKKPLSAYYSARYRCKHNPYYRDVEVRIERDVWTAWWRREQDRLQLSDPVVDRIRDGHYEEGNIRLIERSENSRKAFRKGEEVLKRRIAELEAENAELRRKLEVPCGG